MVSGSMDRAPVHRTNTAARQAAFTKAKAPHIPASRSCIPTAAVNTIPAAARTMPLGNLFLSCSSQPWNPARSCPSMTSTGKHGTGSADPMQMNGACVPASGLGQTTSILHRGQNSHDRTLGTEPHSSDCAATQYRPQQHVQRPPTD